MKRVFFQIVIIFTLASMVGCSSDTAEVKSENVTEADIEEATKNLADLMSKRVEMYRNGELGTTTPDDETVAKVKAYLNGTKGDKMLKGCPWYKEIECSAALAAAVIACGGPEDIPCIVAVLGSMSSCIECL